MPLISLRPLSLLLLTAALTPAAPTQAQKIVDSKVWTTFHKSPKLELAARYKTYSVAYDFGAQPVPVAEPPVLNGLAYQPANADLLLRITVRGLYISKRNLLERAVTKETKAYHYEISCDADYGYELIDQRTHTLLAAYQGSGDVYATEEFKTRELLDAYVQGPYLAGKAQGFLEQVRGRIDYELGPHDYHVELVVNRVEGGAPAYAEISQAAAAFAGLLGGAPAEKSKLAPLAAVWEKHLARANWDDKKSEINRTVANALLENLCAASLLAEDYAQVRAWAELYARQNGGGGMFSKSAPAFKGDESYNGPSTSSLLKGVKDGRPIYHSREEYLDFARDLTAN